MAISFIYNETLTWTVDGVNKVFTSLQQIDQVESIRIWGAEYSDFSFSGNTVTLSDAPTVVLGPPEMDYFVAWVTPVTPSWTHTFLDVINYYYEKVGQDSTSEQFPLSLVKSEIQSNIDYVNNDRPNPRSKIWSYSFNKAADQAVTEYSGSSVPATLDWVSYIPAQGAIIVRDSGYTTYTSYNSTAFMGTDVGFVYQPNDKISIGYPIPSWVKRVSEVLIRWVPLDRVDQREYSIKRCYNNSNVYCIIDDFIFLPYSTKLDVVVTVTYEKETSSPSLDGDIIDLEADYWKLPAYYALYIIWIDREDDRAANWKQMYTDTYKAYKKYIRNSFWINSKIPAASFKRFGNIR